MKKGTRLYSILRNKCPECQEGSFFDGSFFKGTPREHCLHCGLKYEKETGFFQGSYYVAYALGVASFVTMWVATSVLMSESTVYARLGVIIGGMAIATPFMYPLSKIIWANLFFHYKPNKPSLDHEGTAAK